MGRPPRFYFDDTLPNQTILTLPADIARHVQVLRLKHNDAITLFADGQEVDGHITHMDKKSIQVTVDDVYHVDRQPMKVVHLACVMPANDRMDWLIEKVTELGVTSIQPLMSERSVLRLTSERAEKKLAHWRAICAASCEQCGGNVLPVLHPVQPLHQWLAALPRIMPETARFILSLAQESKPLASLLSFHTSCCVLTGPEGGFSPEEEQLALANSFVPANLGARILRAETAAITAVVMGIF